LFTDKIKTRCIQSHKIANRHAKDYNGRPVSNRTNETTSSIDEAK
jgi:hypothetical protein